MMKFIFDVQFVLGKKIRTFLLILFMGLSSNLLLSAEINYQFKDFSEASKASTYIKFEGASTKLGLITTGFEGFAKDIKIKYDLEKNQITHLEVIIPTKSLDTDSNARNDKMYKEIFETEKYPLIHVVINEKIILTPGDQSVDMIFTVKDKQLTKHVKFTMTKVEEKLLVSGSTSIGLKESGLPDPSIVVAKVRDIFDLKFLIYLDESKLK